MPYFKADYVYPVSSAPMRNAVVHTNKQGQIIMRRTQTFNRIVQLGILSGIMNKSKVPMPRVQFHKEITQGHPYDEYLITWMA